MQVSFMQPLTTNFINQKLLTHSCMAENKLGNKLKIPVLTVNELKINDYPSITV